MSISVLPTASLSAKGVGLAGLTGDSEAFSVDSVSFGLSLIPLLSGNVEINAVTIEKPRIVVAFDKNGQSNWTGGGKAPKDKQAAETKPKNIESLIEANPAAAPPAADEPAADAFAALENLTVSRVSIVDGTVIYRDAAGTDETIEALNLNLRMPQMIGAGTAEGSFVWQGHKENVALTIGNRPAVAAPRTDPDCADALLGWRQPHRQGDGACRRHAVRRHDRGERLVAPRLCRRVRGRSAGRARLRRLLIRRAGRRRQCQRPHQVVQGRSRRHPDRRRHAACLRPRASGDRPQARRRPHRHRPLHAEVRWWWRQGRWQSRRRERWQGRRRRWQRRHRPVGARRTRRQRRLLGKRGGDGRRDPRQSRHEHQARQGRAHHDHRLGRDQRRAGFGDADGRLRPRRIRPSAARSRWTASTSARWRR